ncbi:MAG: ATP-binding protein [Myxococcota bacterium]
MRDALWEPRSWIGLAAITFVLTLGATLTAYREVRSAAVEAFSTQQRQTVALLASRTSAALESYRRWLEAFDVDAIPSTDVAAWVSAESRRLGLPPEVMVDLHTPDAEADSDVGAHQHGAGVATPCERCATARMLTWTSEANDRGQHLRLTVPSERLSNVLAPAAGWMLDADARVVGHHDPAQLGTTPFATPPDDPRLVDMLERMAKGESGVAEYLWRWSDNGTSELRLGAFAPVPRAPRWSVAVSASEAEALAGVRRSLTMLLRASSGLVLTFVVALAAIARLTWQMAEQRTQRARERLEAADVAAHTERLAQLGALTAGVAHDLRGPVNALRLGIGVLEDDDVSDPRVLSDMHRAAELLVDISWDLTGFSRADDGSDPRVDFRATLRSTLRMLGPSKAERCEVAEGSERHWVAMRGPRLSQVLLNLISNALAAADHVHITFEDGDLERLWIRVEDDGPGIPFAMRERIFEPFFTTKPPGEGTGLGLPLCRRFVREAGGSLELAESALGGAGFLLSIPVAAAVDADRQTRPPGGATRPQTPA